MSTLFDLLDDIATALPAGTRPRVEKVVSDHRPGQHIVFRIEPGEFGHQQGMSVDGADRYWALIDVGSRLCVSGPVELDPEAARLIAAELVAWADWREGEGAL